MAAHADPTVVTKYQTGFAECANEVTRYLSTVEGVDVDLKSRMLNHLANTVTGMVGRTQAPVATSPVATSPPPSSHFISNGIVNIAPKVSSPVLMATGIDVNNNTNSSITSLPGIPPSHPSSPPVQTLTVPPNTITPTGSPQKIISGVQLIPTRLPNGEVAFVLPSNVLSNGHVPGYVIPVFSGAPTLVSAPAPTPANPSGDVQPQQTVFTSSLPITTTGSAQPTVLPTVLLPSVATIAKPCNSPDPLPMNLTSSQDTNTPSTSPNPQPVTPPSQPPVTMSHPQLEVKVESGDALTRGQLRSPEKVVERMNEDVIRNKVPIPMEEENVWRPW